MIYFYSFICIVFFTVLGFALLKDKRQNTQTGGTVFIGLSALGIFCFIGEFLFKQGIV